MEPWSTRSEQLIVIPLYSPCFELDYLVQDWGHSCKSAEGENSAWESIKARRLQVNLSLQADKYTALRNQRLKPFKFENISAD